MLGSCRDRDRKQWLRRRGTHARVDLKKTPHTHTAHAAEHRVTEVNGDQFKIHNNVFLTSTPLYPKADRSAEVFESV